MVNSNIFWNKYCINFCNIEFLWVWYYVMAYFKFFFLSILWILKLGHISPYFGSLKNNLHIKNEDVDFFSIYLEHIVNIHLKKFELGLLLKGLF